MRRPHLLWPRSQICPPSTPLFTLFPSFHLCITLSVLPAASPPASLPPIFPNNLLVGDFLRMPSSHRLLLYLLPHPRLYPPHPSPSICLHAPIWLSDLMHFIVGFHPAAFLLQSVTFADLLHLGPLRSLCVHAYLFVSGGAERMSCHNSLRLIITPSKGSTGTKMSNFNTILLFYCMLEHICCICLSSWLTCTHACTHFYLYMCVCVYLSRYI